jgi:hypothetical protein
MEVEDLTAISFEPGHPRVAPAVAEAAKLLTQALEVCRRAGVPFLAMMQEGVSDDAKPVNRCWASITDGPVSAGMLKIALWMAGEGAKSSGGS